MARQLDEFPCRGLVPRIPVHAVAALLTGTPRELGTVLRDGIAPGALPLAPRRGSAPAPRSPGIARVA
jgi:hypothetical protein